MSESESDDVGLTPPFKRALTQILSRAAGSERLVVEFRTSETESGKRYLSHAMDITEHVDELEAMLDE